VMTSSDFRRLLTEHKDAVFGLAVYLVGKREDAEDVAQDVFLRLWKAREEIDPDMAKWWLLRVTRNACLDHLRRRKVRERANGKGSVMERGRVGIKTPEDDRRERSLDVSDLGEGALHTERKMDVQKMIEAMDTLREPQRSIIVLREVQDLSYDEIAETLGLTLSAVKVGLHRARKKIRAAFGDEQEAFA